MFVTRPEYANALPDGIPPDPGVQAWAAFEISPAAPWFICEVRHTWGDRMTLAVDGPGNLAAALEALQKRKGLICRIVMVSDPNGDGSWCAHELGAFWQVTSAGDQN